MSLSPLEQFKKLSPEKRERFVESFSEQELETLLHSWEWEARPEQLEPQGDWFCWLVLAGRGWGKSRTAAEWIVDQVKQGKATRIALIGRTAADVRDIQIEGQSGILAVARVRGVKAHYEPSKRRITFENGSIATAYSAEEPNLLRGPEHDCGWLDEAASWSTPRNSENDAYANFIMGLRLGEKPRFIVTTTPRPTKLIKDLVNDTSTTITKGSTYDNRANLSPTFLEEVERRYKDTRLGRQEIEGEVLDDIEGALWQYETIENTRVKSHPDLQRVVVAIDPAVSTNYNSDYTAITVAALGVDGEFYVLQSEQLKLSPAAWANRALTLYDEFEADKIIAEKNNGGDMVLSTIRTVRATAPVEAIHASRGKQTRAEPIAALYEQGKVHHTRVFKDLEDQLITFPVATEHDDLVDSLVYAISELDPNTKKQAGQFLTFSRGRSRRR